MDKNSTYYKNSVAEMQTCLRRLSFKYPEITYIGTDGIYGDETKNAVKDFQKLFSMPQTGVVDKRTWNKIIEEYNAMSREQAPAHKAGFFDDINEVYTVGKRGDAVCAAQIMQNSLYGHLPGVKRVNTNGVYDENTAANTKIIQKTVGMPQTGRLDKDTWNATVAVYEHHK